MNSEISKAVECLKKGGIIIYPSDTIWAIGCDATNSKAISKIFKIKKRDSTLPLICLMNNYQMLNKYVDISDKTKDFLQLQNKPTTIIYNKIKNHVEKINKSCNFLIQINISDEQSKNGLKYDQVDDLLLKIDKSSENMIFRGIMAIPSNTNDESKLCDEFSQMQETFQSLSKQFNTVETLSMGMSNDYQLALKYGATMIRIGTKIFGARI